MEAATKGISDVPIETIETILDFLHDDPLALYSSSLVCRNWLSSPRYHIFKLVLLNEIDRLSDRVLRENTQSFLALIRAEHCTFISHIQCIILNVSTQTLIEDVIHALEPSKKLSQIVLLHHRQRRDTYEINDNPRIPTIVWNGTSLHNVHDFTFNAFIEFGDDAWALFASFPNLRSLAINLSRPLPLFLPSQPHILPSIFRKLQTLRLQLKFHEQLFAFLQASDGGYYALETLDLWIFSPSYRGWGPVDALNSFLQNNSNTLKHLSVGIVDYDIRVECSAYQDQYIDLGPLLNLQSLFLCTRDMDAISDSLATLQLSQELRTLTVNALPCKCPAMSRNYKCNCVLPQESQIARLGGILERLRLTRTTTHVTFNVPTRWVQEGVPLGELTTLAQKHAFDLSYCGNVYNGPVNSFEALSHLGLMVWRDIVPGSEVKPDGSYDLLPRTTSIASMSTVS